MHTGGSPHFVARMVGSTENTMQDGAAFRQIAGDFVYVRPGSLHHSSRFGFTPGMVLNLFMPGTVEDTGAVADTAAVTDVGEVYLPLEGLIDVEAEKARIDKEIAKVEAEVKNCESKLGNSAFVDRAPAELVDREKARRDEWAQKLGQLQEMRSSLG